MPDKECMCAKTERIQDRESTEILLVQSFVHCGSLLTEATRSRRGTFPALAIVVGNGKFRKKD